MYTILHPSTTDSRFEIKQLHLRTKTSIPLEKETFSIESHVSYIVEDERHAPYFTTGFKLAIDLVPKVVGSVKCRVLISPIFHKCKKEKEMEFLRWPSPSSSMSELYKS